jgi:hypothetical protein
MTDETMNPKTLIERTPDTDLLREMIGFGADGDGGRRPDRGGLWLEER